MTTRVTLLRAAPGACIVLCLLALGGCASLGSELPEEPPQLASMEEPPALFFEPDDEAVRLELDLGGYTGIHVTDGRASLGGLSGMGGMGGEPDGVLVQRVVENSPGDAAGIQADDLILAVRGPSGSEREIHWPSDWRAAELATAPGSALRVVVDRAGVEGEAVVHVSPRVRAAEREAAERFREDRRVGVVLRTATEVEARVAGLGLGPGGGAVIVGLAAESPWRRAGLRFGDLIARIAERDVAHPQVVLDAVREAPEDGELAVLVVRGTVRHEVSVSVSQREQDVRQISVPLLFSYGAERGESELSILLGLLRRTATKAAWEWRIFWLIHFGAGDSDRLEEVR